jgi:protein-L-isoaspartate(D-aspartate) O-methyltransferase
MVDEQLVHRGIRDARVLAVMGEIPREAFVPEPLAERAYDDRALPVALRQTISQPWIVARMLELAELEPVQRVLEIGTGTGYQTALLAHLVAEVCSVERLPALASAAAGRLGALGLLPRVRLHVGDGSLGWRDFAPYARVVAAAAAPVVPRALLDQLADGGVLVIPVGGAELQRLEVWRRTGTRFDRTAHGDCCFVPMIGRGAWAGEPPQN